MRRKKSAPLRRRRPNTIRFRRNEKKPAMNSKKSRFDNVDWSRIRILGVGLFFGALWVLLWARAFHIQVVMGPDLSEMAYRQHNTPEVVTGQRGNITDRNGNILAQTVYAPSIVVDSTLVKNPEQAAVDLSNILGGTVNKYLPSLTSGKRFAWLARKVDQETAQKVQSANIRGVSLVYDTTRKYPYTTLAGQLLGFVGTDGKGLEGLEKSMNRTLEGERIRQIVQRDASGRRLSLYTADNGYNDLRGNDVRLTLDTNIQFFAEESLEQNVERFNAKWGGCLVVDVPTGDILAWAQYPYFDPNNFRSSTPLMRRNRISMDALEQGSTIKSFLLAAALEEGVVEPKTEINCERGSWRIGKFVIHDTRPYNLLPVEKILHVSSNIGVAKIGHMLGADKYHEYLTRLGFGQRTGLPLAGESVGILRSARSWQDIDLATASFGQSFSATLLQMGQAYYALANDGVKKPLRLVINSAANLEDELCMMADEPYADKNLTGNRAASIYVDESEVLRHENEDRIFSKDTMHDIRSMLREVVEEQGGTGRRARIPGLVIGGKTGTAQKADSSGKYGQERVGSFVGMLPIENPRYLILVLLDEPKVNQYGGVIATPTFRHVALNTMAYRGMLPDTDDPLVKKITAQQKQSPPAVITTAHKKTPVPPPAEAYSGSTEEVPYVVGLGVHKAIEVFVKHGVVPSIMGSGSVVIKQDPQPGGKWAENRQCVIWLEENT